MPEKYFAIALKKIPISQNDYIYSAETIVAGDLDEKTKVLTSTTGEKYKSMRDFSEYSTTTDYYSNLVEVEHITDIFQGQYSFDEAIRQFEKRQKQIIYYATQVEDGDYILLPIDKYPYIKMLSNMKENPNLYEEEDLDNMSEEEQSKIVDDSDEDPFIASLKALVGKIISGKFSPDELIDIKYRLTEQKEELESAIESVDLQAETLEDELAASTKEKEKTPTVPNPTPLINQTKKELQIININDTFNKVTKTLIAQDKAARRAIVEIARLDDMRKKEYGILLTGESGVGKTLLMRLISKHLNRPVLIIDSTQLTAPAYVGRSIEQYLWDLYESCNYDLNEAERAIIYFDEIDKKGSEKKSDVSGQAVLNTLLKFVEGTDYIATKNPQQVNQNNSVKINTHNMIVTAGGAFLDVYQSKTSHQPIGFSTEEKTKSSKTEPEISDFVKKGMMSKEFMGRFPIIIHLDNLNVDSIRQIMLSSDESALKLQEEVFKKRGVKLSTKDGYIVAIANKALEREIGARGLNKLIADSTWEAYDEISCNPGKYEEVILTEETATDSKSYQLIKKKN